MVVGAKVWELTDGFLWFVCGLYVGILISPLTHTHNGVFIDRQGKKVVSVLQFAVPVPPASPTVPPQSPIM